MLNQLRKAGQFLKGKDTQYAEAIRGLIDKHVGNNDLKAYGGILSGNPLAGIALTDKHLMNRSDRITNEAARAAIVASNAGIRYGVPLAGASALVDGIGGLYDMASSTPVLPQDQSNQLPY